MSKERQVPGSLEPPDRAEAYIAELDRNWRILRLNANAKQLLGMGDQAIGRDYWEIFPLSSGTYARDILEEALEREVSTQFQAYCRDLDDWLHISATPTPEGLRLVAYDVKHENEAAGREPPLSDAGLTKIAEEMRRMADQIVQQAFDGILAITSDNDGEAWTDRRLAVIADAIYRDRRRREEHFPVDFAEPQWNILLDLFIQEVRGVRVSVTSACIAADVPSTTALRALQILVDKGLVSREADVGDRRRAWVALTPQGMASMRRYLRHSTVLAVAA